VPSVIVQAVTASASVPNVAAAFVGSVPLSCAPTHRAPPLALPPSFPSGSNTLWIHSLAILQHRLGSGIRGRVFAIEFVLYTLAEAAGTLLAGWALDAFALSTCQLSSACALVGAGFAVRRGCSSLL
jgi:hypothetical protein